MTDIGERVAVDDITHRKSVALHIKNKKYREKKIVKNNIKNGFDINGLRTSSRYDTKLYI